MVDFFVYHSTVESSRRLPIYALPLKITGIVFAYIVTTHVAPGGNVNYYFASTHEPNDDEKLLNRLIAKHRNVVFAALPGVTYILIDISLGSSLYNKSAISADGIFFYLVFPFFFGLAAMTGAKYLSAWWNMQKVLRKDPTGQRLVLSVKNDPALAKLDDPKPIINLPKILKTFVNTLFGVKS